MKVSAKFEASDGAIIYFDIGFIPDEVRVFQDLDGGTNELELWWLRVLADAEGYGRYGIQYDSSGVPAVATSGSGILTYEEGDDVGVLITHPGSGKKVIASVLDWAASTASVARTVSAIGTVVRPTQWLCL